MTENNMVVVDSQGALIAKEQVQTVTQELQQGGNDTFSSINLENASIVTKAKISTAIATPQKRIADEINMTLWVTDIIIHKVSLADEVTGELQDVPRIILIDKDGVSHVAVSSGIYNVIRNNILPLFGFPTWEGGLPLLVQQGGTGTRKFLTLVPDVAELEKLETKK